MIADLERNQCDAAERDRLQHSCLVGVLLGPAVSAIPVIGFGLEGRAAFVAVALVMSLTATVTWGWITQRVLNGRREIETHLGQRVGSGPTLGEVAGWFSGFVDVDATHYIVAIHTWDDDRNDKRTPFDAQELAREARRVVSEHFGRPIPVGWCWGDEWGYATWDHRTA